MKIITRQKTRVPPPTSPTARGEKRQENLRNTLVMINNRFNALASWDNPKADRYAVELEIISVDMNIGGDFTFPAIEILQTTIVDKTHERIEGIVGNNFSSYVRDYDFSVLLLEHNKDQPVLPSPRILASCTAISLKASFILRNIRRTSKSAGDLPERLQQRHLSSYR